MAGYLDDLLPHRLNKNREAEGPFDGYLQSPDVGESEEGRKSAWSQAVCRAAASAVQQPVCDLRFHRDRSREREKESLFRRATSVDVALVIVKCLLWMLQGLPLFYDERGITTRKFRQYGWA